MKFFNFLLKRKISKYSDKPFETLRTNFTNELKQQRDAANSDRNINYFLKNSEFSEKLLQNILIKIINIRCEDLKSEPGFIQEDKKLKIKLFGDKNYLLDNSKWVVINKDDKLNKELKIKSDLFLSESHLVLMVKEYLDFFEYNDKSVNELILPLIKKSNLNNLRDLGIFLDNLFFDSLDGEREGEQINSKI